MATNKRKILENARKLAQKGAKDKALKEYQKLVKLDPKDAKLKLEIGDAHRRWGQVEEAVDTYAKVAEQYMKEGFDARAVAVYKQILNLDTERLEYYGPLAELYERMGLTAEAIQALQTAADGHHRAGDKRQALELLRRMSTIDPTNTTSRIKVAELLLQEDMRAEAVAEYEQVAAEFDRQGDVEASTNVYRRVVEIDPKRVSAMSALAGALLRQGRAADAEAICKAAMKVDAQEPEHYELLAEAYRGQGREDALPEVYRSLAEIYRQRGDEEKARDLLQRHVPSDSLSLGADEDQTAGEEFLAPPDEFAGSDALEDELSLSSDEFSSGDLGPELELDDEVPPLELSSPMLDAAPDTAESTVTGMSPDLSKPVKPPVSDLPSGDPDQLLAEASVYLRYGKRDKAIAHLEAILRQDSEHRLALEKLGEAFAEDGDEARAVETWLQAAKRAEEDGDADAVAVLRGRIEALDPTSAASLGGAPVVPDPAPEPDPEPVLEAPAPAPDLDLDVPGAEDELLGDDLDLDIDFEDPADSEGPPPLDEDSASELDISLDEPDTPDLNEEEPPASLSAAAPPPPPAVSEASLSTTTAQQILEDLEEADFYMEQALHDEAEEIYKRVLSVAPNHPRALVRLGEVAAARGDDPGNTGQGFEAAPAAADSVAPEPSAAAPDAGAMLDDEIAIDEPGLDLDADSIELDGAVDADLGSAVEPELSAPELMPDVESPTLEPESAVASEPEPVLEEPPVADATPSDATPAAPIPETRSAPEPATEDETGEFQALMESPQGLGADSGSEAVAADDEANFDLAAELSDVFDDDPNEASLSASQSGDDGFTAVFDAFKKGVSETLSEADHEAHFDLGIAYKEMGLLDDAIQEFRASMVHPPRVVECLHLIGLCALEGGQPQLAADHLEQLLESDSVTPEQRLAGRYELAKAYEGLDRLPDARAAYLAVLDADPDYQDAAARHAALEVAGPTEADDERGFESFEDVIAEGDEARPDEAAKGESFDDLMDDVDEESAPEPEVAAAVVEPDPEPAPEPAPEPPPEPAPIPDPEPAPAVPATPPPPAKGKKKRKKISFL